MCFGRVDPSPWPISGSLRALATTVCTCMHSFEGVQHLPNLGLIFRPHIYPLYIYIYIELHHTKVVQLGSRFGLFCLLHRRLSKKFKKIYFWSFLLAKSTFYLTQFFK
jgi:cytochrome c oxidase subunit 3